MDMIFSRSTMPRIPLNKPFPSQPAQPEEIRKHSISTTTLDNGLRVVSCDSQSPVGNVGVFIDAGARYQPRNRAGLAHFLEYMAYGSSTNVADYKLVRDLQKMGASFSSMANREHTMYTAETLREFIPDVLAVLGEVTQRPAFHDYELAENREKYWAVLAEKLSKPETSVSEAIHAAAYYENTVGLPLYGTEEGIANFTDKALSAYVKELFIPQRMVVCAIGTDHASLVEQAKKVFGGPKGAQPPPQTPNYTGGDVRAADYDQGVVHMSLAFEASAWRSKDVYTMCVVQTMMGGGGSFSAGGPGKGMCSRLYTNVLNQYGWVDNVQSFDSIFTDTGLFGINASCGPSYAGNMVDVLCNELVGMARVGTEELERAKAQLKVGLLMQLESRALHLEDTARQMLTYNKVLTTPEVCASIDSITVADVQRVVSAMLKKKPAFVALGDIHAVPRYEDIAKRFG